MAQQQADQHYVYRLHGDGHDPGGAEGARRAYEMRQQAHRRKQQRDQRRLVHDEVTVRQGPSTRRSVDPNHTPSSYSKMA